MQTPKAIQALLASISFAAMMGLASCSKTPQITGQVKDEFGKPVPSATVTVQGTTFTTATDAQGNYAIQYVPGAVTVAIERHGYTSASYMASIATPMQYPAAPVTLVPLPGEARGFFFFGPSKYILVPLTLFARSETERIEKVGISDVRFTDEHFRAGILPDTPTFPSGHLKFTDTTAAGMKLIRISSNGDFLFRKYYLDGTIQDQMLVMPEQVRTVGKASIRESDLAPGEYVFVGFHDVGDWLHHKVAPANPIYPFHVIAH